MAASVTINNVCFRDKNCKQVFDREAIQKYYTLGN
jgi:hypothetical protein